MRIARGGTTTIAGYVFLLFGAFGALVGVYGISSAFEGQASTTWVPVPAGALLELQLVALLACLAAGIGATLVAVARPERDREEESYLDPLEYRSTGRRWRRAVPAIVVVVALTALPGLFYVPVAHSVSLNLPVGSCPGAALDPTSLQIPNYAVLIYHWRSTDGAPISEVRTPSGPSANNLSYFAGNFTHSSFGTSELQGNGSMLYFYACDTPAQRAASAPAFVTVFGTYYSTISGGT